MYRHIINDKCFIMKFNSKTFTLMNTVETIYNNFVRKWMQLNHLNAGVKAYT